MYKRQPSIIITTKASPNGNKVNSLTWDAVQPITDFPEVFKNNAFTIPQSEFKADGWRLESSKVLDLLAKLRKAGTPLGKYVNGKFYRGILTGFNEAFVIDRDIRDRLIAEHPSSSEVIKPFLRGRDVKKWTVDYQNLFLIRIESSEKKQHSWANKPETEAEKIFEKTYPAIYEHFKQFRVQLIARSDQGKYFWELRSCKYWQEFEQPKIIYPDIYEHQSFAIDRSGFYAGNTCYFIPTNEIWLCGVLNSQIIEWFYSMISNSIRGGYLRAFSDYMKQIPIPNAGEGDRAAIEKLVSYVLYLTEQLKNIPSHIATLDQSVTDKRMNLYFEQIIDALVMELYLPEELHEYDKYFMRYLLPENLPSLDTIKGDKMQTLRQIFERLFDKEHPIRHNLFLLNTIPVVRIIEGKS
mgnify:CR=1 FL=1